MTFYCERLQQSFANPSSVHRLGREALKSLEEARRRLARTLDCLPEEIIVTSGASESINTALRGLFPAGASKPAGLAVCPGEHAATRQTAAALSRAGVRMHPFGLARDGAIDLASAAAVLAEKPLVLTYMLVNNETGAIAPADEIRRLRDTISPRTRIHIDAVQAMGRLPLSFRRLQADLLSLSGHKFGAPRGIGLLLVRRGLTLAPLIEGGGQQDNRRSGTENPPLVETLALAAERAAAAQAAGLERAAALDVRLRSLLLAPGTGLEPVCTTPVVPHILALRIPGLRGETLVNALSAEGIMISAGSACSSRKAAPSPVLHAMGLNDAAAREAVRISLGRDTTEAEIDTAAAALLRLYRQLARP